MGGGRVGSAPESADGQCRQCRRSRGARGNRLPTGGDSRAPPRTRPAAASPSSTWGGPPALLLSEVPRDTRIHTCSQRQVPRPPPQRLWGTLPGASRLGGKGAARSGCRGDASGHRGPLTDTSNHERPESKAPGEGWAGRGPRLGDAFGAARGHAGAGTHVSPVGVGAVLALEAAHQALVRLVAHGPHRVQAPLDLGGHGRPSGGLRADSPLLAQPASAGEASAVGRSGHPSRAPPRPSEPGRDCGRHPGPYGVSTDTSCLCTLGAGSTPPPES